MRQQPNQQRFNFNQSGKTNSCSTLFNLIHPVNKGLVPAWSLVFLLLSPSLITAEPASHVAWTPKLLNTLKTGDPKAGKILANNCVGCHGNNGVSSQSGIPSLAGQLVTYIYKQLVDYQNGSRSNLMMTPVTQSLNQQDIINLATWYASLPPARIQIRTGDQALEHSEDLVYKGDGKRILPPCSVCHGTNGQGEKMDIPALAGQQPEYLRKTLMDYKQGKRQNDVYSRMWLIASQLSEKEIEELGRYYYQLK